MGDTRVRELCLFCKKKLSIGEVIVRHPDRGSVTIEVCETDMDLVLKMLRRHVGALR